MSQVVYTLLVQKAQNRIHYVERDRLLSHHRNRKNVYGSLEGEVRFVQTHVISPEGRKNEPEIITGRDALILFKPSIKTQVQF